MEPVIHTVPNPTTYGWQPAPALGLGVGRIRMGEGENQEFPLDNTILLSYTIQECICVFMAQDRFRCSNVLPRKEELLRFMEESDFQVSLSVELL